MRNNEHTIISEVKSLLVFFSTKKLYVEKAVNPANPITIKTGLNTCNNLTVNPITINEDQIIIGKLLVSFMS